MRELIHRRLLQYIGDMYKIRDIRELIKEFGKLAFALVTLIGIQNLNLH